MLNTYSVSWWIVSLQDSLTEYSLYCIEIWIGEYIHNFRGCVRLGSVLYVRFVERGHLMSSHFIGHWVEQCWVQLCTVQLCTRSYLGCWYLWCAFNWIWTWLGVFGYNIWIGVFSWWIGFARICVQLNSWTVLDSDTTISEPDKCVRLLAFWGDIIWIWTIGAQLLLLWISHLVNGSWISWMNCGTLIIIR